MKPFEPFLDGYHDVADQLAGHIRRRAERAFAAAAAERAALTARGAFEDRRRRLRAVMLESIGGLPDLPETVPSTLCGRIDGPDFVIERLLLETLPGVLATANLYLPKGAPPPAPTSARAPAPAAAWGSASASAPASVPAPGPAPVPPPALAPSLALAPSPAPAPVPPPALAPAPALAIAPAPSLAPAPAPAFPAVLFLCGHSRDAKADPAYQQVCRALARAGIAVLALDPVGQGERMQYLDPATGRERVPWGTAEHSYAGFQCALAGQNIARYFLADAMQALSYLAARPEIDAARLGVTGNSGGGTQSSYLIFLDGRLACGAPCTYTTAREAYMATGQPHDAEQNLWRATAAGLDYADLAAGLAPKPLLLGAVASDFFCIEGTLQAFAHLQRVYGLQGRGDDVSLAIAPGTHHFSPILREIVVRFFRRHLRGEAVDLPRGRFCCASEVESPLGEAWGCEPEAVDDIPAEALRVTAGGQVALSHPGARTVFDLHFSAWCARPRPSGSGSGWGSGWGSGSGSGTGSGPGPGSGPGLGLAASSAGADAGAAARLRSAVLDGRPQAPLWVREIETGPGWAHRYAMSEPDIAVPMILLQAEGADAAGPLTVAALAEGTPAVGSRQGFVAALTARAGRLLLFDARGSGAAAQRPVNARPGQGAHGTLHKLACDAVMLGDSLLAMRAFDALRVLEYARRIAPHVAAAGEGGAGLALLIAAYLDGGVDGGRFAGLPRSWSDLIAERYFEPDYALLTHGLADWPDVPALLAAAGAEAVEAL